MMGGDLDVDLEFSDSNKLDEVLKKLDELLKIQDQHGIKIYHINKKIDELLLRGH